MADAKMKPATVNVTQEHNPAFGVPDAPRYRYMVTKTVNTVTVTIGERITKDHVRDLIDSGFTVNVS